MILTADMIQPLQDIRSVNLAHSQMVVTYFFFELSTPPNGFRLNGVLAVLLVGQLDTLLKDVTPLIVIVTAGN